MYDLARGRISEHASRGRSAPGWGMKFVARTLGDDEPPSAMLLIGFEGTAGARVYF